VKERLDLMVSDLGASRLKNIAEPMRVYSLEVGRSAPAKPTRPALSGDVLLGGGIFAHIASAASAAAGVLDDECAYGFRTVDDSFEEC